MNAEFIAMLEHLERERGIKREVLIEAVEGALVSAAKKAVEAGRELRCVIDRKSGDIKAFAKLLVVERLQNKHDEITLTAARKLKPDVQLGEELDVEVTPKDLGRIAAQTAKQAIMQKLRAAERDIILDEFRDRAGEIVNGTVRRFERSDVIVDLGKAEAILPNRERVQTEDYAIGDRIRAYVVAVENGARGPQIILSRSHPNFVRRLFETEVAEINDRTVEIKGIAREPGYRTKVAVWSGNDKVDPVGACVGMKGSRVKNIVRELNNEKVDIIRWSSDLKEFAIEALKPAKIKSVTVDEPGRRIMIKVEEDQLSLAIGKRGQNVRLTDKLTGYKTVIERDETAREEFENKKGAAAHSMAEILGITEEETNKLVGAGMNSIEVIATGAEASDIAAILSCDEAKAAKIFAAAQAAHGA
jgi:transcription termination/antitermination protein NusA